MGTYNGSAYIADQLSSIQAQTWQNWELLVRDDGSSDDTCEIVRAAASRDPRIRLIEATRSGGSARTNFGTLMQIARDADVHYFCLADQDDIWDAGKTEKLFERMLDAESASGPHTPVLVHCDLRVVDRDRKLIAASFAARQGIDPARRDSARLLLVQNTVTGCACMFNRALLEVATPLPDSEILHDWWLALNAATFGRIGFVASPLVSYRHHADNVRGARGYWRTMFPAPGQWRLSGRRFTAKVAATFEQARAVCVHMQTCTSGREETRDLVREYVHIVDRHPLARPLVLVRHGFLPQGLVRKLYYIVAVMLVRRNVETQRP